MGFYSDGAFLLSLVISAFLWSQDEPATRVAYFSDNNSSAASIVAVEIGDDGLLTSSPVLTPTGGTGGQSIFKGLNATGLVGPDALFTQDPVVVSGNFLFAVNAGSDTLSLFLIDDLDPLHPTLIGEPAATLGEFPTSVAYSPLIQTACVLHDGAVNGVTCFSVDETIGLTVLDESPRHLSEVNETTPPTGPAGSVSDILFNPSSTALFVIVKNSNPQQPGFFYVYPVDNGTVSRDAVFSSFPGLNLSFSGSFLASDSRLLVTDPTFGYAIVDVASDLTISLEVATTIPVQRAVCWSVYSQEFDSVYVLDTSSTNLTVADPATGAIKFQIPFDTSATGAFDSAINRNWLYFLAGDASIVVIDLVNNVEFQKFDLSSVGNRAAWVGLAIFPSTRL